MPRVYAIDGIVPVVEPSAFVHPSAALIGTNCVINDNTEIGEDAVVAALAFVKAEALRGGDPLEALTHVEPGRRRIDIPGSVPLSELKRKHG